MVDTVADGNMNPVTSNAVYDKLKSTNITGLTLSNAVQEYTAISTGNLVIISIIANFTNVTPNTYVNLITGLPKNILGKQLISVPNEYGNTGNATFMITDNSTVLVGKCSASDSFYYAQIVYPTA